MHLVTVLPFVLVAFLGSTGVQASFRPANATPEASYLVEYDTEFYGRPDQGAVSKFGKYFHTACVAAAIQKKSHHSLALTAYQEINTADNSTPWVYASCGGRPKRQDGTWDNKGPVTDLMDLAMNNTLLPGKNRILHRPDGKPYASAYHPTIKPTPETPDAEAASPVPASTGLVPGTTPLTLGPGGHGRKSRKGGPKRLQVTVNDFLINGDMQPLGSVDTLLGGIV
ncbi:BZ3500_MvSof-1268-A1-R1_Chr10-1g02717 [Microbotryum saponariae]|uniref:BZ3500_MvSof-1268-A1-R1_Chr10-1g02717 protein n=1 Tax=Microbotryum saponariae TaxID=289078 RepID=A0A2X0L791_9BASI|nr:BZ3500_MvSof-1268-A1-R1_Chr10-1g02717 [Microbotryum saponariae]SDA06206.1 BZ3501_MvSof-1269-A2-R1_Chr10-1g02318 [Microbotryum saponariae]